MNADAGPAAAAAATAPRSRGLDGLKGVAIVLVVGIHALAVGARGLDHDAETVVGGLLTVSVPVFMAVSALLATRDATGTGVVGAVARRLVRLVPLYAVWTGLYVGAAWAVGGPEWIALRRHSVAGIALLGEGWYHLYFLPALVQVLVLVGVLGVVAGTRAGTWAVLAAGVALFAATPFARATSPLHAVLASHWAVVWVPAALAGAAVDRGTLRVHRAWAWCLTGLAALGAEALIAGHRGAPNASAYARAGIPVAVAGLVALALGSDRWPRWLAALGRRSLGVYLVHPALLWALMSVRGHRAYPSGVALPVTVVVTAASFAITAAAARTPVHGLVDGRLRRPRLRLPIASVPAGSTAGRGA